jgi:hypothetical protein
MLVYAMQDRSGRQMLYSRRLDDTVARAIPGTEGGSGPSFTRDGRSILFIGRGSRGAERNGFIIPVVGGTPRMVAGAAGGGLSAGEHDEMLNVGSGVLAIGPTNGGPRRVLVKSDTEAAQSIGGMSWPEILPGGTAAVISFWPKPFAPLDSVRLAIVSLSDGRLNDLGTFGLNPHYAEPGYLIFGRPPGEVFAAPFSLSKLRLTGAPVRLMAGVHIGNGGAMSLSVARNGTLAVMVGGIPTRRLGMVAVDGKGKETPIAGGDTGYSGPRLSPDGRHVAVTINTAAGGPRDGTVWGYDVVTGTRTPISTQSGSSRPEWSPDGVTVFYRLQLADSASLMSRPWDLSRPTREEARGAPQAFHELSFGVSHGLAAIRSGLGPTTISIASSDSLNARHPLFDRVSSMLNPRVSPNGRLLAFSSEETGRPEVYVTSIPGPGARVAVSIDGGAEPMWSRDGTKLFYRAGVDKDARMMSATIVERPSLAVGKRETLFADVYDRATGHAQYDVFPDGRFLMLRATAQQPSDRVTPLVVINWQRMLSGAAQSPR